MELKLGFMSHLHATRASGNHKTNSLDKHRSSRYPRKKSIVKVTFILLLHYGHYTTDNSLIQYNEYREVMLASAKLTQLISKYIPHGCDVEQLI